MKSRFLHALSQVVLAVCVLSAVPALAETKSFDVPKQLAASGIPEFARQANVQILVAEAVIRGKRTNAVQGQYSLDAGLKKLLDGMGLRFEVMRDSTIVVHRVGESTEALRRSSAGAEPSGLRLARVEADVPADTVAGDSQPGEAGESVKTPGNESAAGRSGELTVTGSRIRSAVGEATISPVITYTREDIERTGVTTLKDLKRFIPQLAVGANNFSGNGTYDGANGVPRLSFDLRGVSSDATLVLVNGRRLPKTAVTNGIDSVDIKGLPVSAIERIEVLTDGASAIYGSDAMAGVVNIILKKDYVGTEVQVNYDNTFDSDTGATAASIAHGYSNGPFSLMFTAEYQSENALKAIDRPGWSNDRRAEGGSFHGIEFLFGIADGTGSVSSADGLPLPGLDVATVRIPQGSDGVNLTVADFEQAAVSGPPDILDTGRYKFLTRPSTSQGYTLNLEYALQPWLQLTLGGRWSEAGTDGTGLNPFFTMSTQTLPADYIGNPFGAPIRVNKIWWELGEPYRTQVNRLANAFTGARGDLPRGWRYEAGVSWDRAEQIQRYRNDAALLSFSNVIAAINDPDPALRPIILHDSLTHAPNAPEVTQQMTFSRPLGEENRNLVYDLKFDGPVADLWAGELLAAVGVERREEKTAFPANNLTSVPPVERSVQAAFAEVYLPLVGARQQWRWVQQLDLSLAARHEEYSDVGSKTSPRAGLSWRPNDWLMLRATTGKGFKVPTHRDFYSPEDSYNSTPFPWNPLYDSLRDEDLAGSTLEFTYGGNPALQPETSTNVNYGLVMDVPWLSGLSFTVDLWSIEQKNRIGTLTLQELFDNRPDRFTRAPSTNGQPGPIVAVDTRAINVAEFKTAGIDYTLHWRGSAGLGEFTARATVTDTHTYQLRAFSDGPLSSEHGPEQRPLRGSASLFCARGSFEFGTNITYQESYPFRTSSTLRAPAMTEVNLQTSYDFSRHPAVGGRLGALLDGTKLSLSIINLFNEYTLIDPTLGGGGQFYSNDPRLRRYIISISRTF